MKNTELLFFKKHRKLFCKCEKHRIVLNYIFQCVMKTVEFFFQKHRKFFYSKYEKHRIIIVLKESKTLENIHTFNLIIYI